MIRASLARATISRNDPSGSVWTKILSMLRPAFTASFTALRPKIKKGSSSGSFSSSCTEAGVMSLPAFSRRGLSFP